MSSPPPAQPSPADRALPHVGGLHAYTPGFQPRGDGWIKLNTNENPYPPSPCVEAAIAAEIPRLTLYPDPRAGALRAAIAQLHEVPEDCVIAGNGSDDVLNLLVRVFCGNALEAGMTMPSYSLYPVLTGIQNGRLLTVDFDRSMKLPVDAIADSGANLFFLTSPNAPTGIGFSNAEIAGILERFPGILVVDEAYADFAESNAVSLLRRFPNLVVTRTFSKSWGLAGLRVGYALGHPDVIDRLDRVRDSYNLDRLAQAGAVAAIGDLPYFQTIVGKIINTRNVTARALAERDWFTYPTQANFLFTEPVDGTGRRGAEVAAGLFEALRENRILVRYFAGNPLTESFLRISVGNESQMSTLLEVIDTWLKTTANAPA